MSTLVQTPTTITITLTIERRNAHPADLVRYLERELRKAMEHAQYGTPAGSKLTDVRIVVVEPTPCPACGEQASVNGDVLYCSQCHTTGYIVAHS